MSSSLFLRRVKDAYANNCISDARDAYIQYQDSHCLHPRNITIVDSHMQQQRVITVSCGVCEHCKQTKINEWCTRMYAHAEDFKHFYFVTLTYRSIENTESQRNKLLLAKLSQAVWHYDNLNSTHHYCWRPCVLVKKHYQDFLKRLRKNTGLNDITYVVSGEYGKRYGAPHFHFILFSNGVLTEADIVRAWSVSMFRKDTGELVYRKNQSKGGHAVDYQIGRVDFHDLVANGTFNTFARVKVDGTFLNAGNCFSYVCKYVVKCDKANQNRVILAYKNLYNKVTSVPIFGHDVPIQDAEKFLFFRVGLDRDQIEKVMFKLKFLKNENFIFQPTESIYQHGLCRTQRVQNKNYTYDVELLPPRYVDFRDSFRPFCEFSRATPLGSVYANRHISEFTQGVFNKPLLQSDGFVVPSYFRHKAQEHEYGLRKSCKTIKSNSLVLSGLPDLYGRFQSALRSHSMPCEYLGDTDDYQIISEALQDDRHVFVDVSTKERVILYNEHAQHYKYDRSSRSYKFTRAVPVADWLRYWCDRLQQEFERARVRRDLAKRNMRESEAAMLILADLGEEHSTLRARFIAHRESVKREQELLYNAVKRTAE